MRKNSFLDSFYESSPDNNHYSSLRNWPTSFKISEKLQSNARKRCLNELKAKSIQQLFGETTEPLRDTVGISLGLNGAQTKIKRTTPTGINARMVRGFRREGV